MVGRRRRDSTRSRRRNAGLAGNVGGMFVVGVLGGFLIGFLVGYLVVGLLSGSQEEQAAPSAPRSVTVEKIVPVAPPETRLPEEDTTTARPPEEDTTTPTPPATATATATVTATATAPP